MNPDGESHHERVQVKSSRRESETPGEREGEVVKSTKRKVIRVESEGHKITGCCGGFDIFRYLTEGFCDPPNRRQIISEN